MNKEEELKKELKKLLKENPDIEIEFYSRESVYRKDYFYAGREIGKVQIQQVAIYGGTYYNEKSARNMLREELDYGQSEKQLEKDINKTLKKITRPILCVYVD